MSEMSRLNGREWSTTSIDGASAECTGTAGSIRSAAPSAPRIASTASAPTGTTWATPAVPGPTSPVSCTFSTGLARTYWVLTLATGTNWAG